MGAQFVYMSVCVVRYVHTATISLHWLRLPQWCPFFPSLVLPPPSPLLVRSTERKYSWWVAGGGRVHTQSGAFTCLAEGGRVGCCILTRTWDPFHLPLHPLASAGHLTHDCFIPGMPAAGKVIGETHTHIHTHALTCTRRWGIDGTGHRDTAAQPTREQAQVSGNHACLTPL